jgi:D-alanine-D-alanine ligase
MVNHPDSKERIQVYGLDMETGKKLRTGVIFGGRSGEHEVSLMSARSVLNALDRSRYEVIEIGISHSGEWYVGEGVLAAFENRDLKRLQRAAVLPDPTRNELYQMTGEQNGASMRLDCLSELDVVFPVLHGTFGEDGTLQGLLELADLAYVGAGVVGSAVGMDKGIFKDVMRSHGIPVVDSRIILRSQIEKDIQQAVRLAEELGDYPYFVKPANLGSSVGITKCQNRSDLLEGFLEAARYDRRVLVERGLRNVREIEVSVLGNDEPQASVPGEILPSREYYTYEAKYIDGTSGLLIPAPLSAEQTGRVRELAVEAYKATDCAGMARVDFLLDENGNIYLNELNTIPGFTGISMYPRLWEASGLSYPALVDRLIELALERKADRDRTERRYTTEG